MLELLKLRFGEGALQACEVMLRDVRESKGIDRNIRSDQSLHLSRPPDPNTRHEPDSPAQATDAPEMHAKILSRLFWPELHDDTFRVPPEIAALQARYETGFEKLKQSRKLTWLSALGQVTVELDLEDRVVTEEVQTWQASIIHAFQDDHAAAAGPSGPATHSVAELVALLHMPEPLVRNGLTFWVGKLVLRELLNDTYTVLETLSPATAPSGQVAAAAAASASASADAPAMAAAVKAPAEVALEKFKVYWQFIVGMLTNGGPMTAAQMVGMLRLAVVGGVEFGEDELRDFLAHMVHEEKLEVVAGKYRIRP